MHQKYTNFLNHRVQAPECGILQEKGALPVAHPLLPES